MNKLKQVMAITILTVISSTSFAGQELQRFTQKDCERSGIEFKRALDAAHTEKEFLNVVLTKEQATEIYNNKCVVNAIYNVNSIIEVRDVHAKLMKYMKNNSYVSFSQNLYANKM